MKNGDVSYYVEVSVVFGIGDIVVINVNFDEKFIEEKVIKLLKWVLKKKKGWNEVVCFGVILGLSKMKIFEIVLN